MEASKRTAIARKVISKPLRWIFEAGYTELGTAFHQGAGRPENPDRAAIQAASVSVLEYDPGWGPKHRNRLRRKDKSHAISIYVLNVLPPADRRKALRDFRLTLAPYGTGLIAVRSSLDLKFETLTPYEDGWITQTGTFQRPFRTGELMRAVAPYFHGADVIRADRDTVLIQVTNPRKTEKVERARGKEDP